MVSVYVFMYMNNICDEEQESVSTCKALHVYHVCKMSIIDTKGNCVDGTCYM